MPGRDRSDIVLYVQRQKQETAANFKKKGKETAASWTVESSFLESENPHDTRLVGYIN